MNVSFNIDEKNINVVLDETNIQINDIETNIKVDLENQFVIKNLTDRTLVKILMLKGEKGDAGVTTGASWGYVTGNITDQTDLINLINTDLANYYTKNQTYTKNEVNNLVNSIPQFEIQVVNALPTEDISSSTIYLVPKSESETDDVYNEYIYINSSWELIGSTQIDFSDYYSSSEVDDLLDDKQDVLISGNNIKTINNTSLLGTGNITIDVPTKTSDLTNDSGFIDNSYHDSTKQDTLVSGTNIKTINNQSLLGSGNINIEGGSGGTSDYTDLTNKPSINGVELSGNKTTSDLGITIPSKTSDLTNDSGFITGYTETDPVFSASASAGITSSDISSWNAKSDFSGSYNDLTNKPTIPTDTNDLTNGAGYITSSYHDSSKQDTLVSGTNIKTINSTSLLGSGNININEITELTDEYIRIWDLDDGLYYLSNPSKIRYYGATNNSSVSVEGTNYLFVTTTEDTTYKNFVLFGGYNRSGYMMYGYTSVSSGNFGTRYFDNILTSISSYVKDNLTYSTSGTTYALSAYQGYLLDQNKQDNLVSGTNIKTINNTSLLGSGDISIDVPTTTSELTNDSGFITGISSGDVTGALGYTPQEELQAFELSDVLGVSSINDTTYEGIAGCIDTNTPFTLKDTSLGNYSYDIIYAYSSGVDYYFSYTTGTLIIDISFIRGSGTSVTTNQSSTTLQNQLVSGTNIKTINNQSLLGSGNISISGGGTATDVQINGTSIVSNDTANIETESAYNESTNKIATMSDISDSLSDLVYTEIVTLASNLTINANVSPATAIYTLSPRAGYTPIMVSWENTYNGSAVLWYKYLNGNNISWRVKNVSTSQITGITVRVRVLYIKSGCFLGQY